MFEKTWHRPQNTPWHDYHICPNKIQIQSSTQTHLQNDITTKISEQVYYVICEKKIISHHRVNKPGRFQIQQYQGCLWRRLLVSVCDPVLCWSCGPAIWTDVRTWPSPRPQQQSQPRGGKILFDTHHRDIICMTMNVETPKILPVLLSGPSAHTLDPLWSWEWGWPEWTPAHWCQADGTVSEQLCCQALRPGHGSSPSWRKCSQTGAQRRSP